MVKKMNFTKIASNVIGVSAGAVGGRILSKKVLSKVPAVLRGVGMVAVGAFGPSMLKMPDTESFGDGLIAAGAIELAEKFIPTAISGIGESDDEDGIDFEDEGFIEDPISGFEDEQVLGDADEDDDDDDSVVN
jgi:hypothetical protein